MLKAKGWIYKCELDEVLRWDSYNSLEIDWTRAPIRSKKELTISTENCCSCGKKCPIIKVEIAIKEIK